MNRRHTLVGLIALLCSAASARADAALAQRLFAMIDALDVEHRWPAGQRVDWQTGLPNGLPVAAGHTDTHCSAFVAVAAEKAGIYILRPPEHGQVLLANAQNEWLSDEGGEEGWRPLEGPQAAQDAANKGQLVVASYHNRRNNKPGHIAIVRPGTKSPQQIAEEGPDVIQAGTINSTSISIKAGFAGHVHAWNDNEIDYYAHSLRTGTDRR